VSECGLDLFQLTGSDWTHNFLLSKNVKIQVRLLQKLGITCKAKNLRKYWLKVLIVVPFIN
jgi:hypothetical protein